ncbi:MAG: TonB family protein [Pseudomonadota bacterium]
MGLDQVNTQVLLLHSEQSALDRLSAGIDSRYTVHTATSGMEALTTLGVTPIHVIISAKNLPGMSGVDALREAKKRSPDTVGILLANDGDTGVEALVGEKEVFQIVRNLKPEDLSKIIDNATQQMRLMALAESANDLAANPDEPAEHIVMETAENGSTIISDATGRMRALNQQRMQPQPVEGASAVDVLALSKDEEFLTTVRDSTAGMHKIRTAQTVGQAEEMLDRHQVGVVLIDAGMVGRNVEELTRHLQRKVPRLVSIVAGRRDDGDMLMDLINRGKVYRFLLKPVSPGRARLAIGASIKHHVEAPDSAFQLAAAPPANKAPAAKAPAPTAPQPAPVSVAKPPTDVAPEEAPEEDAIDLKASVSNLVPDIDDSLAIDVTSTSATLVVDHLDEPASKFPLFAGVGAAVVAVIAAGAYFMFASSSDEPEPEAAAPSVTQPAEQPAPMVSQPEPRQEPAASDLAPAVDDAGVSEVPAPVEDTRTIELVDAARLARGAGRLYAPDGNNAIELFVEASLLSPEVEDIAAELAETITETLAVTEQALLERRIDDAALALERVGFAAPDNPRLPFLAAQLAQLQLREHVEAARASIRSGRFESARQSLADARALGLPDTTEIDALDSELRAARNERQVDDVLSRAAASFDAGNLVTPDSDNARYYYELALESEPSNRVALQGLKAVAAALVLRARGAIDEGDLNRAGSLLDEAKLLDPGSAELAASVSALAEARERAAAPPPEAMAAQAPESAAETETVEPEIVPISSLNRTRYVAPRYPRAAERRNTSGWVDVVFTVSLDGTVRGVEVIKAEPEKVFNSSAIRAVERWEFEPVVENGIAVEKRAGVRLMFAIE